MARTDCFATVIPTTHANTHTHAHSASCCGVVRSPAACSVAHPTTGLFCARFIFVDAQLPPCSPHTMYSFNMWPKSNTHTDMDAGFCFASLLAFRSMETRVLTTGLSSVSIRGAVILTGCCYFRSNHNWSFMCLKGEYWYYWELTVYLVLFFYFTCN